ncbi:MAG: 50S ribosomal protein L19 [bacterium]
MDPILLLEKQQMKLDIENFKPGDLVRVYTKSLEGRERLQVFEGTVIGIKGSGVNRAFTVRKMSYGVGVEKVFPLYSPIIDRIEVVRKGKVKRAKLYYIRGKIGKEARIKEANIE